MKIFDDNPQARIVFTFGFAAAALFMIIMSSMVQMPLRAIFIALAVSAIIFLSLSLFGDKLTKRR